MENIIIIFFIIIYFFNYLFEYYDSCTINKCIDGYYLNNNNCVKCNGNVSSDGKNCSLSNNLTSIPTYTGSLAGINAKILLIYTYFFTLTDISKAYDSQITSLGGTIGTYSGSNGIYINNVGIETNSINTVITGGYDSNYDAIFYFSDICEPSSDTKNILDYWYNQGKGVVLASYATGSGTSTGIILGYKYSDVITKRISKYNKNDTGISGFEFLLNNITHPILFGISKINAGFHCSEFSPIEGATGLGSLTNGANLLTYLDDTTGKGRRIDLNIHGQNGGNKWIGYDRLLLQSMLWAARKI